MRIPTALRHYFRSPRRMFVYKIAIVGASTLLGKELKDALSDSSLAAAIFRFWTKTKGSGQLDQLGDEITFVQADGCRCFEHVDFTFFCGTEILTRKHWREALRAGSTVLDLSGALDRKQACWCVHHGWARRTFPPICLRRRLFRRIRRRWLWRF